MTTHLVIVESPAKAKTINKYLGSDYIVEASYGHIRDLMAKNGSVKTDHNFEMVYQNNPNSKKYIDKIINATKKVDSILLATDPDREGEAIAWHIIDVLKESNVIKDNHQIKRVVFSEITKNAVKKAIANPRDIDMHLVDSQQARRALDYLVGFTLSPILWRKLPGSRSAGRVQSVALRLIAERDSEIETFVSQEYWTIDAIFSNKDGKNFKAFLHQINGSNLKKFDIPTAKDAEQIVTSLNNQNYHVAAIEVKPFARKPQPPFITSTLQQEASRKLGFYAKKTMKVAQELYEGIKINGELLGLITYMRTDGVQLSGEAIESIRFYINKNFGNKYLPNQAVNYKSKTLNAQEAHEAIRPTDINLTPLSIKEYLSEDQRKLYDLIWKRTIACQMTPAQLETTSVDIQNAGKNFSFRANGTVQIFDGYYSVYKEGKDDEDDEETKQLPQLSINENVEKQSIAPNQHFTEPPPRYSEASLVKKLEELGIGRPSTYASIISVIQDRDYVRLDKKKFVCEDRGRVVTTFLVHYFVKYLQYDFTANLENQLDQISSGNLDRIKFLSDFWGEFKNNIDQVSTQSNQEVLKIINEDLVTHFFPKSQDSKDRVCPDCHVGQLGIQTGKFGIFIACNNYPSCKYTKQISSDTGEEEVVSSSSSNECLGKHSSTLEDIFLKKGPYGFYVETNIDGKPKRVALPKEISPQNVSLDTAIELLSLPKSLGAHPNDGNIIQANIGRYGHFLSYNNKFTSLKEPDNVFSITLDRAIELINSNNSSADLGIHPETKDQIQLLKGRYGPYIKYAKKNIPIPKGIDQASIDLEKAIEIINKSKK